MLPEWLEHEELYLYNVDEGVIQQVAHVARWEHIKDGTRIYQPVFDSIDELADPVFWPLSLEAIMNEAIAGNADHYCTVHCWEPTEYGDHILEVRGENAKPMQVSQVIESRRRAHHALRRAPEMQLRLEWKLLKEGGCVPSIYEGVDLELLLEEWLKKGYWTLQGMKHPVIGGFGKAQRQQAKALRVRPRLSVNSVPQGGVCDVDDHLDLEVGGRGFSVDSNPDQAQTAAEQRS